MVISLWKANILYLNKKLSWEQLRIFFQKFLTFIKVGLKLFNLSSVSLLDFWLRQEPQFVCDVKQKESSRELESSKESLNENFKKRSERITKAIQYNPTNRKSSFLLFVRTIWCISDLTPVLIISLRLILDVDLCSILQYALFNYGSSQAHIIQRSVNIG